MKIVFLPKVLCLKPLQCCRCKGTFWLQHFQQTVARGGNWGFLQEHLLDRALEPPLDILVATLLSKVLINCCRGQLSFLLQAWANEIFRAEVISCFVVNHIKHFILNIVFIVSVPTSELVFWFLTVVKVFVSASTGIYVQACSIFTNATLSLQSLYSLHYFNIINSIILFSLYKSNLDIW